MQGSSEPVQDEGLVRAIGAGALGTNVFNMTVGAGIFVLPGVVAAEIGSAALLAYLVCAAAVGLVFLCYAEVGSRITRSGGSYAYIEEAFGPMAGFVASVLLWFGWGCLSGAAVLVTMTDMLAQVVPLLREPLARALFLVATVAVVAITNIRSVESGMKLYIFNTAAKLVPLLVLVLAGVFAIRGENLAFGAWPSAGSLGAASIILFFAFAGPETALSASGEIRNPARNVPLGLLLGMGSILALYLGLQMVAQGVLGSALAENTTAPLAAAATQVLGGWGAQMLLLGAVISIFANLSGDLLSTPRILFATARDGSLPAVLARVHPQHHTPHVAIAVYCTIMVLFALSGSFRVLATVASGCILTVYAGVVLSVMRLRVRDGMPSPDQFRMPFGFAIPMLALAVVAWLLFNLSREETIAFLALLATAAAIHGLQRLLRGGVPVRDN